jgi:hypothetical protein
MSEKQGRLQLVTRTAVVLIGAAIASISSACGPATPVPQHEADPVPEWMALAERASVEGLREVCIDYAPIPLVDPANPTFDRCIRRAQAAVDREWQEMSDAAAKRCVEKGTQCCFERLPTAIPTKEYSLYRNICNEVCARALGRNPSDDVTCRPPHAPIVLSPSRRFRTAKSEAIISECTDDPRTVSECTHLPTWAERHECQESCLAESQIAIYEAALEICLKSTEQDPICRFPFPLVNPVRDVDDCTRECRAKRRGPQSELSP